MSSRVRWKDDGSRATPELREIMRQARREVPDDARVEALTTHVLARLTPPPTSATGAGSAQGAGLAASIKLLVIAALGVALGASVWWALPDRTPPLETKATRAPVAEHAMAPSVVPASVPEAVPTPPAPARRERALPTAKSADRTRMLRTGEPDRVGKGRELALLHAARSARRRAPSEALEMLRQHERYFPQSDFAEEREALMIELLFYFDPPAASTRLSAFELRYPHSPYRARLRSGP
jgi:hypothetical protein